MMNKFLKALWKDEEGQSTTEYILMLSVVVMIAMKFRDKFSKQMDGMVEKVGGNINTFMDQ